MIKKRAIWQISLLFLILEACSPKSKINVLSFFFDGVPESNDLSEIANSDSLLQNSPDSATILFTSTNKLRVHFHQPFQDKNCIACHDEGSVGDLITTVPELCYACHEDYSEKFEFLHGPLEMGYCTVCHQPHRSDNDKLLVKPGNSLCFQCHVKNEIILNEPHNVIGNSKCIECHDPHGQEYPYS